MSYAILRTEKLKTMGNIAASLSHNYRNRPTPNADPYRTVNNEHDLKTARQVMDGIKNRLPEKTRKNAVLAIEYLITASPDWNGWKNKEKDSEFFDKAKEWLIKIKIILDYLWLSPLAYIPHLTVGGGLTLDQDNLTRVGVYPPRRSIKIISLSLITVSSFKRASKICDFWKATAETKLPPLLLDNKNRAIPQGCE